jgi:hypothetical protein
LDNYGLGSVGLESDVCRANIVVERQNFTLYFPITSGLLISVVLTLFLWLANR